MQVEVSQGTRKARSYSSPHQENADNISVRKLKKPTVSIIGSYDPLNRVVKRMKIGIAIRK